MKKLLSMLLCLLIFVMPMFACEKEPTDKTKTLDINVWDSGNGTGWVKAVAKEYTNEHPDVKINVRAKADMSDFYNTIGTGENANDTDLYFTYGPKYLQYVTGKNANSKYLEPLNDVLSYTADGESKTIGEKFGQSALDSLIYEEDQNFYSLSFGPNFSGIVYNYSEFEKYGYTEPRTTDELYNLAVRIQSKTEYNGKTAGVGGTPKSVFIHERGYWQSVVQDWWLQYAGEEDFAKYWSWEGMNLDEVKTSATQQEIHQQVGLKKALEALYDIITPSGHTYKNSNYMNANDIQSRFLESNVAMMYPCGNWLELEAEKMEDFEGDMNDFKMMRTPVISALAEKLSEGNQTDNKLCELIDFVDGKGEKPEWATEEDVKIVTFARTSYAVSLSNSTVCVPSYSPAKDLAKDFLKFLYSDKGLKTFVENEKYLMFVDFDAKDVLSGIDMSSWSAFEKSCFDIQNNYKKIGINVNNPLYYNSSLTELFISGSPEEAFTGSENLNPQGFLNADWNYLVKEWNHIYTK